MSGLTPETLAGLGVAVVVIDPSAAFRPAAHDDDPTLWTEPERGGWIDGFLAAINDLHATETSIDQGQAFIAERKAAGQPVPATWTIRLQNLATKRLAMRSDLAEKYPKALASAADLVTRLNRMEPWFAASSDDSRFVAREDVWLATLATQQRLMGAIDRAFETATTATPVAEIDAVSWARGWEELRAMGFRERQDVETAIGGWDNDPREVVRRAKAVKQSSGHADLTRPTRRSLPPVRSAPIDKDLACWTCGGPRDMGVACPACGALPVVAKTRKEMITT